MSNTEILMEFDPLQDGKSKIVLRGHYGTDIHICNTARTSPDIKLEKVDEERNERLIDYLIKHEHTSPFEFSFYDFHLVLPLFIIQQFLRHRTGKFTQTSERFSLLTSEFYVPRPEHIEYQSKKAMQCRNGVRVNDELAKGYLKDLKELNYVSRYLKAKYQHLGVANEIVRFFTCHNQYSNLAMGMDMNNLMKFLKLRTAPDVQYETRQYALCMLECVKKFNPLVYKSFKKHKNIA